MAGRNRCGFVLTSGTHKGKKCNLGAGHDVVSEKNPTASAHKYTPPKERPALTPDAIVIHAATPHEMAQHRRTRDTGERSKERQFTDQVVQAAYDAWVNSGKPDDWSKSNGLLLEIPKAQVMTFKDRVHTSARALAYKASFGADKPGTNGAVIVALRVTDLPANGNGETATTNSESAPTESANA